MESQSEIHLADLKQLHSEKFLLEVYLVQALIFLCQKKVLKITQQSSGQRFINKNLFIVNIGSEFFSYHSNSELSLFTHCLSEKRQSIELNSFIELTIGDKIANQNWAKQKIQNKTTGISIPYNNDLKATLSNSKYFNFIPLFKTDSPLKDRNAKLEDIFITAELKDQIELFDRIYEQTKIYITDKRKNSNRWCKLPLKPNCLEV